MSPTSAPPTNLARDSRGFFCLKCSWPGADFVHRVEVARKHVCVPKNAGDAR